MQAHTYWATGSQSAWKTARILCGVELEAFLSSDLHAARVHVCKRALSSQTKDVD